MGADAPPPTGREVGIDVGLTMFAMPTDGDPIANPRFFRREEQALAKAQRLDQVSLDVYRAVRATLTAQLQAAYSNLGERAVWQQVSQDAREHGAWGSASGDGEWWPACMSASAGGAPTSPTKRVVAWWRSKTCRCGTWFATLHWRRASTTRLGPSLRSCCATTQHGPVGSMSP